MPVGLLLLAPAGALADRGALTLEAGGSVSALRLSPPVGSGASVQGTTAGAELRVRYALTNSLELTLGGSWTAPSRYYHDGVTMVDAFGDHYGQLQSTATRWAVMGGARWVRGTVWRFVAGAEAGLTVSSFTRVSFLDLTGGGAGASMTLSDSSATQVTVAALAGVEWNITDRLAVAVVPRVEALLGTPTALAVVLPLSVSFSWYGLLR